MPDRYRKKPVEIEAMHLTVDNAAEVAIWCAGRTWTDPMLYPVEDRVTYVDIITLEGTMTANPGDWIICGVAGEFYPCRPDIFDATYEPVDPLDDLHLIEFRDDGWTIQHTLAERIAGGTLFDCPISNWTGGDPEVRGRFVLNDDHTIGEAVDG